MRWLAYCITCKANLANMKPSSTQSIRGSTVEMFAEYHKNGHSGHRVLVGYLYEGSNQKPEITIIKGAKDHG